MFFLPCQWILNNKVDIIMIQFKSRLVNSRSEIQMLLNQALASQQYQRFGPMSQFLATNREGTEVDRMHEVTSPVFGPFPPATSQIGRLLGQIHVLQSMTNIVIFIQPFSKQTKALNINRSKSCYGLMVQPPFLPTTTTICLSFLW